MTREICTKCLIDSQKLSKNIDIVVDSPLKWIEKEHNCSKLECEKSVFHFAWGRLAYNSGFQKSSEEQVERGMIIMTSENRRKPIIEGVPEVYLNDYKKAHALVVSDPIKSIQISKQCLKTLLSEKGGFKSREYFQVIQMAIESGQFPSELINGLVSLKNIENLLNLDLKIKKEERNLLLKAEAGWKIEMIENLFSFYFIKQRVEIEAQFSRN